MSRIAGPSMPHPPPDSAVTILEKLLVVFALVLGNAFFVAAEFALVASRKTRIDQLASEGNRSARAVQRALDNINHYIAVTQTGVTIASLLLGGLGEAALEPLFLRLLNWMPPAVLSITRAGIATGFTYFIMTTLHVVIGELMPKALALQKADKLALWLIHPLAFFARLVTPLVWFLNGLGALLLRALRLSMSEGREQVHSPEELDMLFTQSHQGGEINSTEREILHRVVRFSDVTAREVMVPRVEILALPMDPTRQELRRFLHGQPRTRVPAYQGSLDDISGIVHLKDLVRFEDSLPEIDDKHAAVERINLSPIVREALRVPETMSIDRLLVEFKEHRQSMAVVIDEYGGTAGLVTMGDLSRQAFGDIQDEFDRQPPDIEVSAGVAHLAGRVLIDTVNERFDLDFSAEAADTMAGLVLSVLGRPAAVGDIVEVNGLRLRVEQIDRLRITRLALELPPPPPPDAEDEQAN